MYGQSAVISQAVFVKTQAGLYMLWFIFSFIFSFDKYERVASIDAMTIIDSTWSFDINVII